MITVLTLPQFDEWLAALKDGQTKLRLVARLKKTQLGNLRDIKAVGEGIFEMREHFGPGWRMYYAVRGNVIVVMLCGGDKSSQETDIQTAKQLANELEDNL